MKQTVIGILAHVDAGKTTLSEGILYGTGAIRKLGRVDSRDAFLDTERLERERGITIFSKQAVCKLGELQVFLLDTPGHTDFSPEMERALQVMDYAVLVVSGADGVQGHTETLWKLLKSHNIPVFLFINKMDQPGTDRQALLRELQSRLDGGCVEFGGWSQGEEECTAISRGPEQFFENVAVCDEELLEAYLQNGTADDADIARLIRKRSVFPVYFGSALRFKGVELFLDGLKTYILPESCGDEFGARVYKISRDEQGNRLTHLKITGGVLRVKDCLGGAQGEKINQIRIYSGKKYETIPEAEAGMLCAVTGPADTWPGQGFGIETQGGRPSLEPVLSYQILLPDGTDPVQFLKKLRELEEEEPQLHILWNEELGEIHVRVMGEVQVEILKQVIEDRFQIKVEFGAGSIVYKETLAEPVEGIGHFEPLRHYAEVRLLMEPTGSGTGMAFASDCSEDVLDRNWQRLILTHLEEKRHRGVLTGAEITDMKITLIAGRAHNKHTEGGDFRQATYRAVRHGLRSGVSRLLEPYYAFSLEVPQENLGRAMADIERMKGRPQPPLTQDGVSILTGRAPVVTMREYAREVASYTRGRGRLNLEFGGYEPCHNEEEVVADSCYDPEADLDNPTGSVFCSHGAGYVVPWEQVAEMAHTESPRSRKKLLTAAEEQPGESCQDKSGYQTAETGKSIDGRRQTANAVNSGGGYRQTAASANSGGGRQPKAPAGGSWTDDKELEEIFRRTFGEPKRRDLTDSSPVTRTYRQTAAPAAPPEEEYLLVDGYNIIFAWEELRELSKTTIDGARQKLMDILSNYQGFHKCTVILVFDFY